MRAPPKTKSNANASAVATSQYVLWLRGQGVISTWLRLGLQPTRNKEPVWSFWNLRGRWAAY